MSSSPAPSNSPDPSVPVWLRGLPRAPEYRPTESEFADPIAFLSRVERAAAAFGICKIIPPYPRPSRRFAFSHLNRSLLHSSDSQPSNTPTDASASASDAAAAAVFTTRHQELGNPRRARAPQVLKQVWQSGEYYTLEQFEAKSRAFSRAHLGGLGDPSPLTVEALFWNAAADRPIYIEYANDVPGSCFAAPLRGRKKRKREVPAEEGEKGAGTAGWRLSSSPWNLQAIARAPGSLTRFMPDDVPGVTSPMVYIGMLFSWFAWHVEDHELHSLNFLHSGAPKTWYAVPGDRAADLEEVIRVHGFGGDADRLASLAMLGEKTTLMSPEVLVACGLPCCRLVQYPGEFVVTFPRAYHVGFSHGFNCGEAANFATPQWLKFAKDAAVRRAAMNYLPMLSHQQLLYLLAVSFISRTPRELLSGIRTSRLRDRRKEDRELLVKKSFLQDLISENKLLCTLLEKKSTMDAVLWEPELLSSPCTVLHSCTSGLKAHERKADDSCRMEEIQCNLEDNSLSDGTACPTDTQCKHTSTDSKSCGSTSVSEEEKIDDIDADEDDLPFDLSIDSGSLTCVACGILGYPFMAILQPSGRALEEISLVNREECCLYSGKEKCSNEPPCSPEENNSGCPCTANQSSSSPVEVPHLVTVTEEQANFTNQNGVANSDSKGHTYKVCLMEHELDQSRHQNDNSSHSCSRENTLEYLNAPDSCSKGELIGEATEKNSSSRNSPGLELSKQADRNVGAQVVECCDDGVNWNTSSVFARPRIFCLQHALEIEELLQGKGGAHVLVICHSDYLKVKALAISIAEEIGFQLDCYDVPLGNASKSDLHLINISIDDEGHEEDGKDWTSRLGLNLKYCVKLRKEASGNQEQLSLSLGGLFSDPSPISVVPNLKWLCKKARTPYKVVGYVSSRSGLDASTEKVKPAVMKTSIGTVRKVYESRKRRQTFEQCGLLRENRPKESDDIGDMHKLFDEKNDYDGDYLLDIPIALAEYPLMHHVSGGTVSVSTSHEFVCSLNSQDSPPHTIALVEFNREQRGVQSTELSSSATISVQQLCENVNEKITKETNLNCISNHENLDSQNDTLEHEDESLQFQQDQNSMELGNNANKKLVGPCLITDATLLEDMQETIVAATPGNERNCAKTSDCFDTVLGTGKSATADELEAHNLGGASVTSEVQFNHDDFTSDDISTQQRATTECLASTDTACSTELQSIAHDLVSNELQVIHNSEMLKDRLANPVKVDGSQSTGENVELKSNETTELVHESPTRDVMISEDVQDTSTAAIPEIDGKCANVRSTSFDILPGVLAKESKIADGPGADDVSGVSLSLMTLASHYESADDVGLQAEVAETAGSSGDAAVSDEAPSICCTSAIDKLQVIQNPEILQERPANTEEVDTSTIQSFKDDRRIVDSSVNSVAISSKDGYIDGHNDLHISDVVARSIGNSKRTDIICYVRRKGKRKREPELKIGSSHIGGGGFVRGPCESLRPRAGPALVENMARKAKIADNSAAKGKRMKTGTFECDIDFCYMTFETRAELHAHKRNMCTVESCGKRFSSHKYLKRHQCVHSDERPFKCPWEGCRMTFKWLWAQTEHVRVHTGERPYKCTAPGCGQRFRYVSDFSRHRKKFNHHRY